MPASASGQPLPNCGYLPARLQPLQTASQLIPLSPLLPVCETTNFILVTISTHAPFAREVPGGVPLAMFGRDSLPVRETLASSHVAGAPPAHQH